MGEARNEISSFRKAGDHPAGRAIASASASDVGEARRLSRHLTDGATSIRPAGRKPWKTAPPGRTVSGTEFLTLCVARSVQLALDEPELSPRELATRFTASVYGRKCRRR